MATNIPTSHQGEREALDAYSKVVVTAAEQVGPAVVRIETEGRSGERDGLGSGFIYQSDGSILTNAHVVANATRVQVKLADGRVANAGLVAIERSEDLAVLRISSESFLAVAELSAEPLVPGQLVVAIGNPFGLGWSVTAGVVSALGRALPAPEGGPALRNLIQTQTPINPGNSGGPLVNGQGRVVGITTAIVPYGQGIGFAIPVDSIYNFLARVRGQQARRGATMGVSVYSIPLDPRLIQGLQLRQRMGVTIIDVITDTPADKGGLRPQDIILSADSLPVQDARELAAIVQRHKPGDKLVISFIRDFKVRQVTLILS